MFGKAQNSAPVLTPDIEEHLDSLASRVGQEIAKHNHEEGPVSVLVFDFTSGSPEASSRLGRILADRLAELLKTRSDGADVMDRKLLKAYLEGTGTNIEDLQGSSAPFELTQELGATAMIRGSMLEDDKHQLKISLRVRGLGRGFVHTDEEAFPISNAAEESLFEAIPSTSITPDVIPTEPNVLNPHLPDVTYPVCIECHDPKFSEMARKAKANGVIELLADVNTGGEVTTVFLVKGLPFGLTQQAISAVKSWKFKPALRDGKPVAARVPVEFTFKVI